MQIATAESLDALATTSDEGSTRIPDSVRPEMLADPIAGQSLRNYLILTHRPDAAERLGLTPDEVFWSRSYWLGLGARLWEAQHGADAGLGGLADRLLIRHGDEVGRRVADRVAIDSARTLGDGPSPDGPWFASLDPGREVDGIRQCLGPLSGRNAVGAKFYDGPGWRRFRPVERLFLAVQGGTRRARRAILRHLDGLPDDARVLEVGIGDGANLPFLPSGWTAFGVDIAEAPLRGALARNPALRGRLALAEAEALPFAESTFDACVSVGGFNYYGDHARALEEMARVVRPGGRLVVADEGPGLHRWGIGHLLGLPRLDAAWLRALGLDPEFVAMVHGLRDDPEAAARLAWPGATRHAIWAGVGYCYSATRPERA